MRLIMLNRNSEINKLLFRTEPVSPMSVHLKAWSSAVKSAADDPFDKYALYTSRSLFVKHPEIYLRADRRFYHHVSTVPGYKNAFLEDDRESMEFLPHAQYYRSAPFSLDLFPWDETTTVTACRSLYPDRYPFLPYADRRMLPIASTLKTSARKITELEMASIRFQRLADEAGSTDGVFVLYSEEEMAWVSSGDRIFCAATGEEVTELPGRVILVMNDRVAWYPLMDRDDRDRSPHLRDLVARAASESATPELTGEEAELLETVRGSSSLEGEKQEAMATIAAVRSTGRYTWWFEFHTLWDLAMPAEKERAWQYYGYLEQFMIRSNKLSPITAFMAACSLNTEGYNKILTLDREWIDLAALPHHNYVWGHLWDECLVEYTVDESFRINSGHCMAQACIISACLDMAGIDNYLLEGEVPGSHHYVYVPEYEFTYDNGKLQSSQNTIHWNGPRGNRVIARFHYRGRFSSPIAGGHYSGTFSPAEAVAVLRDLQAFYGDTIPIYRDGEHETNKRRIDTKTIPTTDDFEILLDEEWEELHLP
ncbi:MAG: hypothetical protein R6U70_02270 [Bacillota bacterium]